MSKIIEIEVDKIILKKRIRVDMGDLFALMKSMKKYGQLAPIIINEKYELIAGNRRLEAVKKLEWRTILACMIDRKTKVEKLELELEENIQRKQLTGSEISDGYERMSILKTPNFFLRIWYSIKYFFKRLFFGI